MPRVAAVVVAYGKTDAQLLPLLSAIAAQVAEVVVVDNSETSNGLNGSALQQRFPGLQMIKNHANLGVARGLNQGATHALERGAEFLLLLDDDSMPEGDMVPRLLAAWRMAADQRLKIAAVAPNYRDAATGQQAIFPELRRFGVTRHRCAGQSAILCDYLTSSGMLISREVYQAVGAMNEALFIDYVDTDWCLRARTLGHRFLGVCNAHMRHQFGSGERTISLWGGRRIPYREATRLYYIYRNGMVLLRADYSPLAWKLRELARLTVSAGVVILFGPERLLRLKMILLGLMHGGRGIGGRMQVNAGAG